MDIRAFWRAVLSQNREQMKAYFKENASINWHCTNEHFTLEEYIIANCEYPGQWDGEIERIEQNGDLMIMAAKVYTMDRKLSFHVVSFIRLEDDKIISMDEYWGDDGPVPQWRLDKHIGVPIH